MSLLLPWLFLVAAGGGAPATAPATPFHRLALEHQRYLPAPLRVTAEDLVLQLSEGGAFTAEAGGGPTALVLVGKGSLTFAPPVASERRQLQLFAGSPVLMADFESAFVRLHPDDFASVFEGSSPRERPAGRLAGRAEEIFREEIGRSYTAEGADPSAPVLSVLPPPGDLIAAVRTRRHGVLTYARLAANPEDISLVDRERARHIASYPSRRHRDAFGFDYGDEHGLPYEADHYEVEITVDPVLAKVRGRALAAIRSLETLETASLRLDGSLSVESVRSASGALHAFLHQKRTDTLLVRFEPPLERGREATLEIRYEGALDSQELATAPERAEKAAGNRRISGQREILLYSNRVYWFPQSPVRNHTTASLAVTVPRGYTALASAVRESVTEDPAAGTRRAFFRSEQPIRYLSLLVGRLDAVEERIPDAPVALDVLSSPRRSRRARALFGEAARILRFFSSLMGEAPYPRLTLVLIDAPSPAAHSPAHLGLFGEPSDWVPASARDSPTHFASEPVFHVAHEIAHQWWGQAVGWRNYREQWLSEAFAQYFAALYVRESRGERAFRDVLSWMHRWALEGSGEGPVSLGVRVGQITSCDSCFPAVVYNRGAVVLHMVRGLVGDDAFFRGLRLYYERWKFRRAGTEDLRTALEESSGRSLRRFFDEWIRDDGTPELRWRVHRLSDPANPRLRLEVEQVGRPFELPLQVSIEYEDRLPQRRLLDLHRARQEFDFELEGRFRRIRLNETFDALCQLKEARQ